MKKKVLSLLVVVCLLVGVLAVTAITAGATGDPAIYADPTTGVRKYCECGNSYVTDENGTVFTKAAGHKGMTVDSTWKGCDGTILEWTPATALPTTTGNYYLTQDVVVESTPTTSVAARLDLAGYEVSRVAAGRVWTIKANVTITDTGRVDPEGVAHTGKISADSVNADKGPVSTLQGGVIWVGDGTVNLYGGVLDATNYKYSSNEKLGGTAIYVSASKTFNQFGGEILGGIGGTYCFGGAVSIKGNYNMYGGKIVGGSITGTGLTNNGGGAVGVYKGATFTMHGGTITGGEAAAYGGAVCVKGTFNMQGGIVGGDNLADDGETFVQEGGKAKTGGGNFAVYDDTAVLTIGANATVAGGSAAVASGSTSDAGNIYVEKGTVNVYGTVKGGTAYYRGGNIRALGSSTLNIYPGAKIEDGSAYQGGNLNIGANVKGTITGGTITGGEAVETAKYTSNPCGGNIYITGGTRTISGVTVSGGEAKYGGNIYITDAANLTLQNVQVSGGTSTTSGGAIYADSTSVARTLTLDSANVSGGIRATENENAAFIIKGNSVIDNFGCYEGMNVTVEELGDSANVQVEMRGQYEDINGVVFATATEATDKVVYKGTTVSPVFEGGQLVWKGFKAQTDVEGGVMAYGSVEDAIAAYTAEDFADEKIIKVLADDTTVTMNGEEAIIDLNGKTIDKVTGTGTLYGMDNANKAYETANMGQITSVEGVTIAASMDEKDGDVTRKYIALEENGVYTFHRVYLKITGANLRANYKAVDYLTEETAALGEQMMPGVYFQVTLAGDEDVLNAVDYYGIAAAQSGAPTTLTPKAFTASTLTGEEEAATPINANGTMIYGMIKQCADEDAYFNALGDYKNNALDAEKEFYGRPYISVNGETIFGDAVSATLKAYIEAAFAYEGINENQLAALSEMNDVFEMLIGDWGLTLPELA